ncbi:Ferrous iron transport protein C [Xenorhabdus poinarii G6]|uniref:Probable [Fe-S]-dependent transcriptional repressor n=1 Tax=Xenorhabdus poinarii G6 TaxID=1354304 RepID=A0A068QXZ6_9GAMM|nr:FeoC-like transcriptional regulator [Xenorhabdus poinarii]CDG19793.1 Ferrous iron transport protein C [Xenorhabdus poinarii G6]
MIDLLKIRDAVALNGRTDARSLSHQFSVPLPMVEAILKQLVMMGKLEEVDTSSCLSGGCKQCPETQKCDTKVYQLAVKT